MRPEPRIELCLPLRYDPRHTRNHNTVSAFNQARVDTDKPRQYDTNLFATSRASEARVAKVAETVYRPI